MTSNVPLLQGLAADLRPMFKEQANQSLREQVAAQKQRDAADKRMEQIMGNIQVDPNQYSFDSIANQAKEVTAKYYNNVSSKYAVDKTYPNSIQASRDSLEAQAELAILGAANKALSADIQKTLLADGDYIMNPKLQETILKGGDIPSTVKELGVPSGNYQPGLGLVPVLNREKAWKQITTGVATTQTDVSTPSKFDPKTMQITTQIGLDEDKLKKNAYQYWLAHPVWQQKFATPEEMYASFSPEKSETIRYLNIAHGNDGNTYNFGGGYGNDAFKLKPDAPDYFSVNSVSGVGNNPTWDLPGKKAFTDKDGTTAFDMKALKGSYQGIITTPDANGKPVATHIAVLVPEHTGKDPRPEFNTIDVKIPAQTVFIPVDQEVANDFNSKTQTKTKSGVDLPGWHYKDMSKKSATPKEDDFSQYKRKK
jgi:hypothetical protein